MPVYSHLNTSDKVGYSPATVHTETSPLHNSIKHTETYLKSIEHIFFYISAQYFDYVVWEYFIGCIQMTVLGQMIKYSHSILISHDAVTIFSRYNTIFVRSTLCQLLSEFFITSTLCGLFVLKYDCVESSWCFQLYRIYSDIQWGTFPDRETGESHMMVSWSGKFQWKTSRSAKKKANFDMIY